ncbi:MAG: glycosyltransferase [Spirochaetales bacterium]|nr:glycosyltransferase [Spirochaetales bacterium]
MKIAIVIDKFDDCKNGASISAQRFVDEKRKNGHEVVIISTGQPKEGKFVVPEFYIPMFKNVIKKMDFCFGVPDVKTLRRAFKDVDIIHLHFPFKLQRKAYKIAKEMHKPVIAAFHIQPENMLYNIGLAKSRLLTKIIYKAMIWRFYNKFENIHCPTEFAAEQLRKHGCKADLHIISNGFLPKFHPIETERPKEWEDKFIILTVGRLAKEKNQNLIIKAIDNSEYRDKIQLIISGSGPQEAKLKKLAKALPNPPIIGYQTNEDLLKYFNMADLYVHASNIELESLSTLEAMACGLTPVISNSPYSATKCFSLHEKSTFEYDDIFSLTERIDYWIEHQEELQTVSDQYLEESKKYTLDVSVKKAENLYRKIIKVHKERLEQLNTHDHKVKVWAPLSLEIDKDYELIKFSKTFNFFSDIIVAILAGALYVINKSLYGLKIENKKILKQLRKEGAISVANHCHILDATMIDLIFWPRRVHIPSLKINFEIPIARHLLRIARAFPIPPGNMGFARMTKPIARALEHGDIVHFFPEASLWPYHRELRPFVEGAFYFAHLNDKPIIPMAVTFKDRKILPPKTIITILDPIYPADYKKDGSKARESVKKLTEACYKAINDEIEIRYK